MPRIGKRRRPAGKPDAVRVLLEGEKARLAAEVVGRALRVVADGLQHGHAELPPRLHEVCAGHHVEGDGGGVQRPVRERDRLVEERLVRDERPAPLLRQTGYKLWRRVPDVLEVTRVLRGQFKKARCRHHIIRQCKREG